MDPHGKLRVLIDLAGSLGISTRHVPSAGQSADHPGGAFVRLRGQQILFLDPTAAVSDQIDVVVEVLRGRKELDDVFLPPEIRELLDPAPPEG